MGHLTAAAAGVHLTQRFASWGLMSQKLALQKEMEYFPRCFSSPNLLFLEQCKYQCQQKRRAEMHVQGRMKGRLTEAVLVVFFFFFSDKFYPIFFFCLLPEGSHSPPVVKKAGSPNLFFHLFENICLILHATSYLLVIQISNL